MGMETARAWLAARGFEDRIRTFEVSSATVELAARALGVETPKSTTASSRTASASRPRCSPLKMPCGSPATR